jgi:hypothetical protein
MSTSPGVNVSGAVPFRIAPMNCELRYSEALLIESLGLAILCSHFWHILWLLTPTNNHRTEQGIAH